jgi:hypothetical protein
MVRKWTEDGGGGEKREKRARMVAEFQRGCYHNSTVPVKEYLEVIEKRGDKGTGGRKSESENGKLGEREVAIEGPRRLIENKRLAKSSPTLSAQTA